MRFTRLIIGFLVIFVAVAIIASEQLAGASADAVINARLTTIRAPIAGTLSSQRRPLGSKVALGEQLGSLQDNLVDGIRLGDLVREREAASADIKRVEEGIAAIEVAIESLEKRIQIYRSERLRQLEAAAQSATSLKELAEGRAQAGALGDSPAGRRIAELELEDARQRAIMAEIALASARQGVFLADGYNDAPFSEQQSLDLSLRLSLLRAELAGEAARAAALDERIAGERLRVNRLGSAELVSNVEGRLWEVLAGSGETVERGQDILKLIDCEATIVTLSVSEGVYNRLKVGDNAVFRTGGEGRTFAGTITRLAGSGAGTIYRNLAIAPSERHLQRYDVTLLSPSLRDDPDLGCAVGRTGRVFFEARPLDFLRRFWD
ncbi:MAG: HlyD family efflux transporter periplasmic adaptor subunit [Mesorhizobium sp.]|nr:HlyD family efflux transporter periplasmic adaptor subunit [Mesorhizobium sp.]